MSCFFDYIAHYIEDFRVDHIADYICELSYAKCTRINAVETQVQFALAVPVSGLSPGLKRSDGSFPQASSRFLPLYHTHLHKTTVQETG